MQNISDKGGICKIPVQKHANIIDPPSREG